MAEPNESRVGVYIDFDNVVISRYDQLFGRGDFIRERARHADTDYLKDRLERARVDIGAIIDYASSFGTIAVSRAYADWWAPANANYKNQLVNRAVELVQLFQVTAGGKNGADIRLSVDVVEDLQRFDDLTHVVIVAGDSDYVALVQSAKRLGRYVVGIGVAGSVSRALLNACNEFTDYDDIPGVPDRPVIAPKTEPKTEPKKPAKKATAAVAPAPTPEPEPEAERDTEPDSHLTQEAATDLLVRALRIVENRSDEDWVGNSQVKNQMLRMDPSFKERSLGYKSFTAFVDSRDEQVEVREGSPTNQPRLRLKG